MPGPTIETMPADWDEAMAQLEAAREMSRVMGGPEAIDKLHARGKLTPRQRIERLVDPGTFREIGELVTGLIRVPGRPDRTAPADGVVTGWATVGGRRIMIIADDGTITAGARGPGANRKARHLRALADRNGYPLVLLLESSANRFQSMMGAQFANDSMESTDGLGAPVGEWVMDGRSPVVCAVLGTALGAASFQTMDADFSTLTADTAAMALAGPPVVMGGIGVAASVQDLGGADHHARTTGFIDHIAADEDENLATVREFLSLFPDNSRQLPPRIVGDDPPDRRSTELTEIVPLDHRKPYDMHRVIEAVVDDARFLELRAGYARNVLTGYARIDGWTVGLVANQPMHLGGIFDVKAVVKTVRFAQICNAYNIPLVFLQDQPGFIVGPQSEREGALRQVVRMMNTAFSTTTPVLTVLVRKAYGFSTILLGGRTIGADLVLAWPSASISLSAPEIGVATVLQSEVESGALDEDRQQDLYRTYRQMSEARFAAYEYRIDEVIDPADTRSSLAAGLAMAEARRRNDLARYRAFDTA